MKPRIPASLRERKRYLVFEIIASQNEEERGKVVVVIVRVML